MMAAVKQEITPCEFDPVHTGFIWQPADIYTFRLNLSGCNFNKLWLDMEGKYGYIKKTLVGV